MVRAASILRQTSQILERGWHDGGGVSRLRQLSSQRHAHPHRQTTTRNERFCWEAHLNPRVSQMQVARLLGRVPKTKNGMLCDARKRVLAPRRVSAASPMHLLSIRSVHGCSNPHRWTPTQPLQWSTSRAFRDQPCQMRPRRGTHSNPSKF